MKKIIAALRIAFIVCASLWACAVRADYPSSTTTALPVDLDFNGKKISNIGDVIVKGPWADVRAYGAVNDGVTDNTLAIQAAIDSRMPVYIPPGGTYLTRTLTLLDDTYIFGMGNTSVLKLKNSTNQDLMSAYTKSRIVIMNLKIDGNKANNAPCVAIRLTLCEQCLVENIWVDNDAGGSVTLVSSDRNIVRNVCSTYSGGIPFSAGTGGAIGAEPSDDNLFEGCVARLSAADGFYIDLNSKRNKVRGCAILYAGRYGIVIDQSPDNLIEGNTIVSSAAQAILVTNNTADGASIRNMIKGNKIISSGATAIQVDGSAGNVNGNMIEGNQIFSTVTDGILLSKADYTVVHGNSLENIGSHGIEVSSSSFCSVNGNTLKDTSASANNVYSGIFLNGSLRNVVSANALNETSINKASSNIREAGASDFNLIQGNTVIGGVTAKILTAGANTVVENNIGYNPLGVSAITVGASPFTYTAGASSESIYVRGGVVSSVKRDGVTIATASPTKIELSPHKSVVITYSSVPTVVKDIH